MSKECPKCRNPHEKSGIYCSRKCANSRVWSEQDKIRKSISAKSSDKVKAANRNRSENSKKKHQDTWNQKILNASWKDLNSKKKRVLLEQDFKCNRCGLNSWLDQKLTLELEHKDGNSQNNDRENLECLCPNCHSLTETWRGRQSNRYKKISERISDEDFIFALKNTKTIRQALIVLGMAAKGANYKRAYELKSRITQASPNGMVPPS